MPALISRTREAFGLAGVRLVAADGAGARSGRRAARRRSAHDRPRRRRAVLELHGGDLEASERRLLDVIVVAARRRARAQRPDPDGRDSGGATRRDGPGPQRAPVRAQPRPPPAARRRGRRSQRSAHSGVGDDATMTGASSSPPPTRACRRSTALVTDLLDVSRVQAGVLAVSLAPVDAATWCSPPSTSSASGPSRSSSH